MQYELRTDFWSFAKIHRELGSGARLYDGHNTITLVSGNRVIWWWRPEKHHQELRLETERLAEFFGKLTKMPDEFTPEKMSPGRLIRAFMTHYLKLELDSKTKWYGDRYYYLVKSRPELIEMDQLDEVRKLDAVHGFNCALLGEASHWHYLYLAPQPKGYAVELDIKSAYFTAFLKQPTMFLNDPKTGAKPYFVDDGGAMRRLREINPELPKWFRLQMLGILGSHQQEYYQFKEDSVNAEKTVFGGGIKYGMAFNAAHKAIYTVYETMATVANLIKDDLLRSHTDSFCVKTTMSRTDEAKMLTALADKGFSVSCKGIGYAHFWNLDQGILGFGKPKGHIQELEELRKRDGVYVKPMPKVMYDRWSHWLPELPEEIRTLARHYEFVPVKNIPQVSPEKLGGYWKNDWALNQLSKHQL